jgi:RND family efflux transporter MFP subunit
VRKKFLPLLVFVLAGCRHPATPAPSEDPKAAEKPEAPPGTPVKVVAVTRSTLSRVVTGPGRTVAFLQQKVRAPFAGTLTELKVVDGDQVHAGDTVGIIVSRESEAALSGAREMLREAHTPVEKADAERALALAEKNLVRAPLRAASDGLVLSHAAAAGDRVSEDQEILSISPADSIVFQADIPQSDLPEVRPGQRVVIALAGRTQPIPGVVHDVLATANPTDLTLPVRIDPRPFPKNLSVGLFGIARITVGEHPDAQVLPPSAVIRDDVSGVARIATLTPAGHVHWVEVTTGLIDGDRVEIVSPALPAGQKVIVAGQVGLPEDAPVIVQP